MAQKRSRRTGGQQKSFLSRIFFKGEFFDYSLLFVILFLVVFGLVMVFSTSSYTAELKMNSATYYLKRQAIFGMAGIVVMLLVAKLDYHWWKNWTKLFIIVIIALLFVVAIWGSEANGSSRWIELGPIRFQPSEIAKFIVILYTAHVATIRSARISDFTIMLKTLVWPGIVCILIMKENLSTGIICAAIAVVIVFVTSPRIKEFLYLGGICVLVAAGFLAIASYRLERIKIWLNPEKYEKGYQTMQALYAVGSGGLFGKGLGQSVQKLGFIPESHNDMIFSVICEELGLFGAVCVVALFALLIWRCVIIAMSAPDLFGALIVVGVVTHIGVQVIINIAVVTNTFPPTGVPLPFISYGGTSLFFLLMEMGLVLSVARQIRMPKEY